MLKPAALIAAPAVALAIVGALLLGPGAPRPLRAARIDAGRSAGSVLGARVELFERFADYEQPAGAMPLALTAEAPAAAGGGSVRAEWRGRAEPDGTAEAWVRFDRAPAWPVHVRVATATGEVLAEGDVPRDPAGWGERAAEPSELAAHRSGDLEVRLAVARAVVAAGFAERMLVEVRRNGAVVPGARVTLEADGADLDAGDGAKGKLAVITDASGRAALTVLARAHQASLAVRATSGDREGRAEASLPIVPGACWLDAPALPAANGAGPVRIVSPVARDAVWVDLASDAGREAGARVALAPAPDGTYAGRWTIPGGAELPARWLTIASDPRGGGAGTVGWMVTTAGGLAGAPPGAGDPFTWSARAFPPVPVLDGMPAAVAREKARLVGVRTAGATTLALAATFEAALLAVVAWRSRRDVRRAAATEAIPGEPAGGALAPAIAIAVVLVAFAAIGLAALWRLG